MSKRRCPSLETGVCTICKAKNPTERYIIKSILHNLLSIHVYIVDLIMNLQ